MRALVTWGSKMGGTEGIGRILAETLASRGFDVVAASVEDVRSLDGFDAVLLGGGLYANRWPANARRFAHRHVKELRRVPVWLFSSGPLDDSADHAEIPPSNLVAVIGERIGAKGHVMFGGRLAPDAKGFPAAAMAKTTSGDWRNPDRIRAWAERIADELPTARPGQAIDHPARSVSRLVAHGVVGWAGCAAVMALLVPLVGVTAAFVLHAIAAPLIFAAIAHHYFRGRGARQPLPTAIALTAIVLVLDVVVIAGGIEQSLAMLASIAGTWLPLALVFVTVWSVGAIMSTLPWPKAPEKVTPSAAKG